ncbi:MAG: DUF72 domain-containing protein [Sphingomonadaceae bacterium]|nr:DUF72 domain-containing protein [Sphingomonadaceae bacterium]
MTLADTRVGTAGWSIPRASAAAFPATGTTLERYASIFNAVEVNSSFYRPHMRETWERWAASTPDGFRFAIKLPKAATHERRLVDCGAILDRFADETAGLGAKRGPALIQLPPSLTFSAEVAARFFAALRERFDGPFALEPRHASWFERDAQSLVVEHEIALVAADPPRVPGADRPGGWRGLSYWRLHGSPEIYRTPYGPERRARIANALATAPGVVWCVFDNTITGAAAADALAVRALLRAPASPAALPSGIPCPEQASASPPPATPRA